MANEEDDYMGDLSQFLPTQTPISSKKVPIGSTQSSKKMQNRQQHRKVKREREQEEEDKKTLENINSCVIPQSNIGFKLLKRMGYEPGRALGKDGSGRAEPVGVEIRRSRAGVGRERREREAEERERGRRDAVEREFGWRKKEQWRGKRVLVNFRKANGVLEQLEGREESGDNEEEEEEEVITEEDLLEILVRLREEHQYCLFCGCRYESMKALLSNCPGLHEDDH